MKKIEKRGKIGRAACWEYNDRNNKNREKEDIEYKDISGVFVNCYIVYHI